MSFRDRLLVGCFLALFAGLTVARADVGVSAIVSLSESPNYVQRHHALHKLSTSELEAGASALIDFMSRQQVPKQMDQVEYMSLVNDSFNRLIGQGIRSEQLLNLIIEVIPDQSRHEVWRDYSVQKLGYTLNREDISAAAKQAGFDMLERATSGEFPRMQGTALMIAFKLSERYASQFDFLTEAHLGKVALKCAADPDSELIDRVTALQIAGLCAAPGALDYCKSILRSDERSRHAEMLLVSAIATIGELGNEQDLIYVENFRLSPDIRFRSATQTAFNKIQRRN